MFVLFLMRAGICVWTPAHSLPAPGLALIYKGIDYVYRFRLLIVRACVASYPRATTHYPFR